VLGRFQEDDTGAIKRMEQGNYKDIYFSDRM
jgi:hypothetical protein